MIIFLVFVLFNLLLFFSINIDYIYIPEYIENILFLGFYFSCIYIILSLIILISPIFIIMYLVIKKLTIKYDEDIDKKQLFRMYINDNLKIKPILIIFTFCFLFAMLYDTYGIIDITNFIALSIYFLSLRFIYKKIYINIKNVFKNQSICKIYTISLLIESLLLIFMTIFDLITY